MNEKRAFSIRMTGICMINRTPDILPYLITRLSVAQQSDRFPFDFAVRGRSRCLEYSAGRQGTRGRGRAKWTHDQRGHRNDGYRRGGSGQPGGRFLIRRTYARDDCTIIVERNSFVIMWIR